MKRLQMDNGSVTDAEVAQTDDGPPVCNACQRPGADVEASDGENYHADCVPGVLRG